MSDDVSSLLDPTDEAFPDSQIDEEEAGELESEDDLLDFEAAQIEEDEDA